MLYDISKIQRPFVLEKRIENLEKVLEMNNFDFKEVTMKKILFSK